MSQTAENGKKMLKELIKQLQEGASPTEVKEKFKKVLAGVSSEEIARIEQELVKEGMPREELSRLCDVHMAVFKDQLQEKELHIPPSHPVAILMKEHEMLIMRAERLGVVANLMKEACDWVYVGDALTELQSIAGDFQDAEKHYLREENVLFPILEKHGVTEPPAIMWMEHDKIREQKKQLHNLSERWKNMTYEEFKKRLGPVTEALCKILPDHFSKENTILFPTALQVVTGAEWKEIRKEFDEIGYSLFAPQKMVGSAQTKGAVESKAEAKSEDAMHFENGNLSKDEIEAVLDTLPIDISFVDTNDAVKYFNKAEKRIFVRTKAVLGRKVQMCHPQKSIDVVNRIVEAFKSGRKDTAEFWLTLNNRLVHIRYFAVRDKGGKYLGTMEVTQDLTDLKKIEGQKRLLDWKD